MELGFNEVNIDTFMKGIASELFEAELKNVVANITDLNTNHKPARELTLKFSFKSDEDRKNCVMTVQAKTKLAPREETGDVIHLVRRGAETKAVCMSHRQVPLFEEKPALNVVNEQR